MAYQSLNIIGSFTAGVPAVNRDIGEERSRVEAYRSLMRSQVQRAQRESAEDVSNVEAEGRMMVGDAPHERRNPYLALRGGNRNAKSETTTSVSEDSATESVHEEGGIGSHLDVII